MTVAPRLQINKLALLSYHKIFKIQIYDLFIIIYWPVLFIMIFHKMLPKI